MTDGQTDEEPGREKARGKEEWRGIPPERQTGRMACICTDIQEGRKDRATATDSQTDRQMES